MVIHMCEFNTFICISILTPRDRHIASSIAHDLIWLQPCSSRECFVFFLSKSANLTNGTPPCSVILQLQQAHSFSFLSLSIQDFASTLIIFSNNSTVSTSDVKVCNLDKCRVPSSPPPPIPPIPTMSSLHITFFSSPSFCIAVKTY